MNRFAPSLADIFGILLFVFLLFPIRNYDIFWHLRAGEYIVTNRIIPATDPFSSTMQGEPWQAHEWLSEIIFYILYRFIGYGGLIYLKALLLSTTFLLLVYELDANLGSQIFSFTLAFFGFLVSGGTWLVRPQIFSFLLFILLLKWVKLDLKPTAKHWILIPILFWIWAGLHGVVIFGLGLYGLVLLGGFLDVCIHKYVKDKYDESSWTLYKNWISIFLLSMLTSCLTPRGFHVLTYPIHYLKSPVHKQFLLEWHAPVLSEEYFFTIILIIVAGVSCWRWRVIKLKSLLPILGFMILALSATRNVPYFGFLAVVYVSELLSGSLSLKEGFLHRILKPLDERLAIVPMQGRIPLVYGVIVVLTGFLYLAQSLGILMPLLPSQIAVEMYPVKAVHYIKTHELPRPMLNFYAWGGYLMWETKAHVWIDGRADLYAEQLLPDYMQIASAKGNWLELLNKYQIKTVFFDANSNLVKHLSMSEVWQEVLSDNLAVILIRASTENP